jgi:hypothetical protein
MNAIRRPSTGLLLLLTQLPQPILALIRKIILFPIFKSIFWCPTDGCLFHFNQAKRRMMIKLCIPKDEVKSAMQKGYWI